jgi:hypothetical protein
MSESIICAERERLSIGSGAEDLFWSAFDMGAKVHYQDLDGSNRTKSDGEMLLSQRTRRQTHPQGICEDISGQCDFTVYLQELTQEMQIRRSFLRRRRTAWKTSDFFAPALQHFLKKFSSRVPENEQGMSRWIGLPSRAFLIGTWI